MFEYATAGKNCFRENYLPFFCFHILTGVKCVFRAKLTGMNIFRLIAMYRYVFIALIITMLFSCAGKPEPGFKPRPTSAELAARLGVSDDVENEYRARMALKEYKPGEIQVRDLNGRPASLENYRGKVILLNFFATWALPCQLEMQRLNEIYNKYKDKGLEVLGVAMDVQGELMVPPFVDSVNIDYRVYLASGETVEGQTPYGKVDTIPVTLLLDPRGKEIKGYIGPISLKKIEDDVRRALAVHGGGKGK